MSWLSEIVGGFTGKSGADAIQKSADKASETSLAMFDKATALNEPFRQAGLNALGLQGGLLGMSNLVPQDAVTASMASNPNSQVWSQYLQDNPGVAEWAVTASQQPHFTRGAGRVADYNKDGTISQNEMAQYHYNTYGRAEGRSLGQPTGTTGQPGAAQPVGQGYTPDAAYDAFNNSGFAKSMLETTNADYQNMIGAFGAGGNALSGSAIGALNDRNRRNTSNAFNNYYNALSGISGTGANIGAQQGSQAIATGDRIAGNIMDAGAARASSYGQGANALAGLVKNVATAGADRGWF